MTSWTLLLAPFAWLGGAPMPWATHTESGLALTPIASICSCGKLGEPAPSAGGSPRRRSRTPILFPTADCSKTNRAEYDKLPAWQRRENKSTLESGVKGQHARPVTLDR